MDAIGGGILGALIVIGCIVVIGVLLAITASIPFDHN